MAHNKIKEAQLRVNSTSTATMVDFLPQLFAATGGPSTDLILILLDLVARNFKAWQASDPVSGMRPKVGHHLTLSHAQIQNLQNIFLLQAQVVGGVRKNRRWDSRTPQQQQ